MSKTKKVLICLIASFILFVYSFSSASATFNVNGCSNGGSFCFSLGNGNGSFQPWSAGMYSGLGLPGGTIFGILTTLLLWALGIFGIVAIIGFLVAGIIYLTSAGNEDQAAMAKRAMKYSVIGIIVGLSGWIIIMAISNALSQSSTQF
jgi:hypothetical protein